MSQFPSASRPSAGNPPLASGDRIAWVEWVRAIGCCAIVLLHVLVSTANRSEIGHVREVCYLVVSVVATRWAVPAFLMITGFLLLDPGREMGMGKVLRYMRRMACALLTFGTAFAVLEESWVCLSSGVALSPDVLVRAAWDVATMRTWDHLWYVYALMGAYPFALALRWLRDRHGEMALCRAVMLLFAVTMVVPTALSMRSLLLEGHIEHPFEGNMLFRYARNLAVSVTCIGMGGCIRRARLDARVIVPGVMSPCAMVALGLASMACQGHDDGSFCLHWSCLPSAYAILCVLVARHAFPEGSVGSAVGSIARDSFGIYVIHPLYVHLALLVADPMAMPPVLAELALFIFVLVATIMTVRAIRHVPWLGTLV